MWLEPHRLRETKCNLGWKQLGEYQKEKAYPYGVEGARRIWAIQLVETRELVSLQTVCAADLGTFELSVHGTSSRPIPSR